MSWEEQDGPGLTTDTTAAIASSSSSNVGWTMRGMFWEEKQRAGPPDKEALLSCGPYHAVITSKYITLRMLGGTSPSAIVSMSAWGEAVNSFPIESTDALAPPVNKNKRVAVSLPEHWRFPSLHVVAAAFSFPLRPLNPFGISIQHAPLLAYILEQGSPPAYSQIHLVSPEEAHAAASFVNIATPQSPLSKLPKPATSHAPPRALVFLRLEDELPLSAVQSASSASSAPHFSIGMKGRLPVGKIPIQVLLVAVGERLDLWALVREAADTATPKFRYNLIFVDSASPAIFREEAICSLTALNDGRSLFIGTLLGSSFDAHVSSSFDSSNSIVATSLAINRIQSPLKGPRVAATLLPAEWRGRTLVATACSSELLVALHPYLPSSAPLLHLDVCSGTGGVISSMCWTESADSLQLFVAVGESVICAVVDSTFSVSIKRTTPDFPREDVPIRPNEPVSGLSTSPNGLLLSTFHRRNVAVEERSSVLLKMANGVQYVRRLGDQSLRATVAGMISRHSTPKCYWDLFCALSRLASKDDKLPLRLVRHIRATYVSTDSTDRIKEEALKVCSALYTFVLKHQQPDPEERAAYAKVIALNRASIRSLIATRIISSIQEFLSAKHPSDVAKSSMMQYLAISSDQIDVSRRNELAAALGAQPSAPHCVFCDAIVTQMQHDPLIGACSRGHATSFCCFTFLPMGTPTLPTLRCSYCGISGFDVRYDQQTDWSWLFSGSQSPLCPYCGDLCR
jgi:hypothetical protein